MLVIHSELDYRLPVSEGLAMFNVLQARGVPSKLLMFPDENHVSFKQISDYQRKLIMADAMETVGTEAREFAGLAQGGFGLDQSL